MSFEVLPIVGNWYRRVDRPQPFQVVALDSSDVDIEYFDGTVDEWPLTHWCALEIEPCDAPQDWTGPFDNIEPDDQHETGADIRPVDLHETLEASRDEADLGDIEDDKG